MLAVVDDQAGPGLAALDRGDRAPRRAVEAARPRSRQIVEQDVVLVELERVAVDLDRLALQRLGVVARRDALELRRASRACVSRAWTICARDAADRRSSRRAPSVSESGSCVTITTSPWMPWARAMPPISIARDRRASARPRLFEDLDERALARPGRDRLDDRAQRASGLAAAADDLAEIGLGDLELVDVGLALLDQLDADFVGLVDEVHREIADQLGEIRIRSRPSLQRSRPSAARLRRACGGRRGERAARLRADLDPLLVALVVELQHLGGRVIRTEQLDEPAVTSAALVSGDDAIERRLLLALT